MAVLTLSYDLYKESGRVYDNLIDAIKALGSWCHPTESTWYLQTSSTPQQVFQQLQPHLHARDKLIVSEVAGGNWWSGGLPDEVLNWLHSTLATRRSA